MPLTREDSDEDDGDVNEEELEVSQVAENLQISRESRNSRWKDLQYL